MAGLNVSLPKPTVLQPSEEDKQLVQGYQKEQADLQSRVAPIKDQMGQLEGQIGDLSQPVPPPKLQPIPQYQPRQQDQGEIMTFMTVSTVLAALGARMTRTGITGALTAAGGAMKGFNEGNIQQAKLDMANFNTKMGAVIQQNNRMLAEYKAVLEDRKLTLAQKMNQYRLLAAKYDDEIAMSAAKQHNIEFLLNRNDKFATANWQAEQLWQRTNAALMGQMIRLDAELKAKGIGTGAGGGSNGLTPDAIDNMASYLILNGRLPIGMTRSMSPVDMQTIQNRAAELSRAAGMSAQDFAAAGPIAHAKLGALAQLERARNANQSFERMLDMNIEKLKALSAKVSRSGSPYANHSILWLENNAAGDPDVAEYLFQVNTVSTETARILSNMGTGGGMLSDSMRAELQQVMNPAYTPEQWNTVLGRAQQDARNRSASYDTQVNQVISEIRDPLHKAGAGGMPSFATERDAAAAAAAGKIKSGDKIRIGNQTGTWH